MIDKTTRQRIIALINKEVVPAMGCTEPMAVALAVAKSKEMVGTVPERIEARLSANILKNAMGVGIPGTGMIGLPIAIALGAIIGNSAYGLEVLKDITPTAIDEARRYVAANRIDIGLKEDISEKLYIEIIATAGAQTAKTIIAGGHTNFICAELNGNNLLNNMSAGSNNQNAEHQDIMLDMKLAYDFATTAPLQEIAFIKQTMEYNMKAAQEAIKGNYGHNLGKTIDRPLAKGIFGNSIFSHIIAKTASACDARMGGAVIPVMSNSGSGNQGICATNPVNSSVVARLNTFGPIT